MEHCCIGLYRHRLFAALQLQLRFALLGHYTHYNHIPRSAQQQLYDTVSAAHCARYSCILCTVMLMLYYLLYRVKPQQKELM